MLDDVSFTAQQRRDTGHCGHLRLRPEGAAGGHRRPAARGGRQHHLYRAPGPDRRAHRQGSADIIRNGRALSFVPEDRLGMGLVGSMDITDNMMLRSFRQRQILLCRPQSPKKLADAWWTSWRSTPGSVHAGAQALRRQRAEGAGGPRDRRPHRADDGLRRARTGYQFLLHHLYDLLNRQKKRASPSSTWARIWTCCWSCATGSGAVRRQGQRHRGRTRPPRRRGLMMTGSEGRLRNEQGSQRTAGAHSESRRPAAWKAWGIRLLIAFCWR
jgi:hypothetical protein